MLDIPCTVFIFLNFPVPFPFSSLFPYFVRIFITSLHVLKSEGQQLVNYAGETFSFMQTEEEDCGLFISIINRPYCRDICCAHVLPKNANPLTINPHMSGFFSPLLGATGTEKHLVFFFAQWISHMKLILVGINVKCCSSCMSRSHMGDHVSVVLKHVRESGELTSR